MAWVLTTPCPFDICQLPVALPTFASQINVLARPKSNNLCGQHCMEMAGPPFGAISISFRSPFGSRTLIAVCAVGGPPQKTHPLSRNYFLSTFFCIFSAVTFNSIYTVLESFLLPLFVFTVCTTN